MEYEIKKVAVLGSGVMGARIAAYIADLGYEVLLMGKSNAARSRLERLKQTGRTEFKNIDKIVTGTFDDYLDQTSTCDWIIETVVEDIKVKEWLFEKVDSLRRVDSIVSTDTSGIPITKLAASHSKSFREHFLGTHFFNPPEYAKLVEIVPGKDTNPNIVSFITDFFRKDLKKTPIIVKDTPNFVANRLAAFNFLNVFHLCDKNGYSVEEIDAVCGKAMGRTRTAIFKTVDAIGLDTVENVTCNLQESKLNDEKAELFHLPEFALKMLERGWLGDKKGQGFYKTTTETEEMVIDIPSVEYRTKMPPYFPCLEEVERVDSPEEKVKKLVSCEDRGSQLAAKVLMDDLCYAANRIGEIADSILEIDYAMKLGYYWRLGPFEYWDVLGVDRVIQYLQDNGQEIPHPVRMMADRGNMAFYKIINDYKHFYDFVTGEYKPVPKFS
jgi:3-hydroxyacyl-CoA dehydrogenase